MFRVKPAFLLLPAVVLLSARAHAQALPQLVYDSLSGNLNTPAATTNLAIVDDYTSALSSGDLFATFRVARFSFVGGPIFTGASTVANSSIRFTFLNQFGGFISSTSVQFDTSGSFLRTVDALALNLFAAEKGFFQVTTSATTSATMAFTDSAPTIGSNSPTVGNPVNGVRAFSITAAAAPEPAPLVLLVLGGLGLLARRRQTSV